MTQQRGLFPRVVLIAGAIAAMGMGLVGLHTATLRAPAAAHPTSAATSAEHIAPIAHEAGVFRAGDLPVEAVDGQRRNAHPRTLPTYRGLRAFPGAPPRIPHGLTASEYRTTGCRTCHERGGYSQRFGAYAPLTPHPELADCLSCHLSDAALTGIALPDDSRDATCRQCHDHSAPVATIATDWRPAAWPRLQDADNTVPPPIPHDVDARGNCNACHAGVAAVAEIRTTHPERTDCRQCHVQGDAQQQVFVRPTGGGR